MKIPFVLKSIGLLCSWLVISSSAYAQPVNIPPAQQPNMNPNLQPIPVDNMGTSAAIPRTVSPGPVLQQPNSDPNLQPAQVHNTTISSGQSGIAVAHATTSELQFFYQGASLLTATNYHHGAGHNFPFPQGTFNVEPILTGDYSEELSTTGGDSQFLQSDGWEIILDSVRKAVLVVDLHNNGVTDENRVEEIVTTIRRDELLADADPAPETTCELSEAPACGGSCPTSMVCIPANITPEPKCFCPISTGAGKCTSDGECPAATVCASKTIIKRECHVVINYNCSLSKPKPKQVCTCTIKDPT